MGTNELSVEGLSRRIDDIAADAERVLRDERGEDHDERLISSAIREIVAGKLEALEHGLDEMFTSPARSEFQELASVLERRTVAKKVSAVEQSLDLAQEFGDESVFTGRRVFSKAKMAAMMEYLTFTGHHIYKTSLNKLLFYADLTNFYLSGHGMSGAIYYNRRFGPVADAAEPVLSELIGQEKVIIEPRMKTLGASEGADADALTDDERKVLNWVAETYGPMTAGEVSEFSHNELAYRSTGPNEPIAYAYAQFFKNLPPKNLLGH